MTKNSRLRWLLRQAPAQRRDAVRGLTARERCELAWHWRLWARGEQLAPPGDWRLWLIMAGRGFGKTRAGAEWVREVAAAHPDARIALVGASLGEARAVMIEALTLRNPCMAAIDPVCKGAGQRALADARLAGHENELALAGQRQSEPALQFRQFSGAADQSGRARRSR